MKIPKNIKIILELLNNAGHSAFIVGGAVRDYLLGLNPSDFDITTSALPNEILSIFKNFKTFDIGIKHGTVGVLIDNDFVEITTYRLDEGYKDYRHPQNVVFTDKLNEDLSRRDFTINALAYNTVVIDYFGGINDIKNKIIKTVGDPSKRFSEDVLRILRALRFACQLKFNIEEETKKSILSLCHLLPNIASERITTELVKMLDHDISFILEEYLSVFQILFPELKSTTIQDKIKRLKYPNLNLITKAAIIFSDFKNPETSLDFLKLKTIHKKKIMSLLNNKDIEIKEDPKYLSKLLIKLKLEDIYNIESFRKTFGFDSNIKKVLPLIEKIPNNTSQLKIKGNEIISLGIEAGPKISQILNELLIEVIDGNIDNNKLSLITYIKNNYI